jgi:hypothetical protein
MEARVMSKLAMGAIAVAAVSVIRFTMPRDPAPENAQPQRISAAAADQAKAKEPDLTPEQKRLLIEEVNGTGEPGRVRPSTRCSLRPPRWRTSFPENGPQNGTPSSLDQL